jgi:hypothetical protein
MRPDIGAPGTLQIPISFRFRSMTKEIRPNSPTEATRIAALQTIGGRRAPSRISWLRIPRPNIFRDHLPAGGPEEIR